MPTGRVAIPLLLAALLWTPGCMSYAWAPGRYSEASSGAAADHAAGAAITPVETLLAAAVAEEAAASAGPTIGGETVQPAGARKLVRDAGLVIGVVNRDEAVSRAGRLAVSCGGYIQIVTTDGLTLRVPADRFDGVLEELVKLGLVTERKVQVRDVTEEYVDLELRLKGKRALLTRLEALAAKADKVEDLLKVEQELSRLTLEIEQLEGKLRLLSSRVAMSCIAVRFTETAAAAQGRTSPRLPFWWLQTLGLGNLVN